MVAPNRLVPGHFAFHTLRHLDESQPNQSTIRVYVQYNKYTEYSYLQHRQKVLFKFKH